MKILTGKVVSNKMAKTIIVAVETTSFHPLYRKNLKSTKRIKAHCEDETVKLGDMVKIISVKPLSKEKHYKFYNKIS